MNATGTALDVAAGQPLAWQRVNPSRCGPGTSKCRVWDGSRFVVSEVPLPIVLTQEAFPETDRAASPAVLFTLAAVADGRLLFRLVKTVLIGDSPHPAGV